MDRLLFKYIYVSFNVIKCIFAICAVENVLLMDILSCLCEENIFNLSVTCAHPESLSERVQL